MIAFVREMVECESPSEIRRDRAVCRTCSLIAYAGVGEDHVFNGGKYGPHLQLEAEFQLPGKSRRPGSGAWPFRYGVGAGTLANPCRFASTTAGCGGRACWT